MKLVGVDVGGSAIKLGVVEESGRVVQEDSVSVAAVRAAEPLFATLAGAVRRIAGADLPRGVGIGLPAMLDASRDLVRLSPNLPWLNGVRVRERLAAALALPPALVRVENDANVAALGEQWLGSARDEPDVLFLTLGTGIGSGLVLGGRLIVGKGLASEAGHLCIDPEGPPCGCGSRGCIESFASARAVGRRASEAGLPPGDPGNLELLAARAREADGPERALLLQVGRELGHALAAVVVLLDLHTFVFGGGFAAALDTMEPGIRRGVGEWARAVRVSDLSIRRAALGPSAGWIGAARLTLP
ncbi:MAG: ROK family protein [Planctomycetota bacterium]